MSTKCPQCGMQFIPDEKSLNHCVICGFDIADRETPNSPKNIILFKHHTEENFQYQVRPWVRFWARFIDSSIYAIIIWMVYFPVYVLSGGKTIDDPRLALLLFLICYYIISIPLESLCLSIWGITPGKVLLKTTLHKVDGGRIKFKEALARTIRVMFRGCGLNIPIIALFTQVNAYGCLKKNGITSWDKDGNFRMQHCRLGVMRVVVSVFFVVVVFFSMSVFNKITGEYKPIISLNNEQISKITGTGTPEPDYNQFSFEIYNENENLHLTEANVYITTAVHGKDIQNEYTVALDIAPLTKKSKRFLTQSPIWDSKFQWGFIGVKGHRE